jgi:threonine/homoserine/homoserine lactone efflux protein
LQGGGGVLLLYLAWSGYRQLKGEKLGKKGGKEIIPGTFLKAVTVNLLNPNPYLGWSLVMGPLFLKAWGETPFYGMALIISFYGTMTFVLALTIIFFGTTSFINERNKQKLQILSYILLSLLGIYQLIIAFF